MKQFMIMCLFLPLAVGVLAQPIAPDTLTETAVIPLEEGGANLGSRSVAWSPDGSLVAVGMRDGSLRVVDPAAGEEIARLADIDDRDVYDVDFHPDGEVIVAASADNLALFNVTTGESVLYDVRTVTADFHPDGDKLLVAQEFGSTLFVIPYADFATDIENPIFRADLVDPVQQAAFSPDGSLVGTVGIQGTGYDMTVRVYDAETGEAVRVINPDDVNGGGVAISADNSIVYASGDGLVAGWDIATGEAIFIQNAPGYGLVATDETLIVPGGRGRLYLVDPADGTLLGDYSVEFTAGTDMFGLVFDAALSPDGTTLAIAQSTHNELVLIGSADGTSLAAADAEVTGNEAEIDDVEAVEEEEAPPVDVLALLEEAKSADPAAAGELYAQAVSAAEAQYATALTEAGQFYFDQREFEQAEAAAQQAVALDDTNAEAYRLLGMSQIRQQKDPEVYYANLLAAAERGLEDADLFFNLGQFGDNAGLPDETVIGYYERAIELGTEDVSSAYYDISSAYVRMEDYEAALDAVNMAIENGDTWVHNRRRAFIYTQLGDWESALADRRFVLEALPESDDAHNEVAWALVQLDQFEEALELAERAVEIDPENRYAVDTLAWAQLGVGETETAEETFNDAIALGEPYAHYGLAVIDAERGDTESALANLEAFFDAGYSEPEAEALQASLLE